MATTTANPAMLPKIVQTLEKATDKALGGRTFLTAERAKTFSAFRPEYTVIAASEKTVLPLGGREFSVHTAIYKGAGLEATEGYLFIDGSYGLTLDRAYAEFIERSK